MPVGTEARKKKAPAPLRKPATLDHLRKARSVSEVVSFCTEDIPEPEPPKRGASEADQKAYDAAYAQWKSEVEAATVEVVLSSMPRKKYRELLEAHPPTDKQIQEAKERGEGRPSNDGDAFAVDLLAHSITEPEGVTKEDAQFIIDNWPAGEVAGYTGIVTKAIMLNEQSRLEFHQSKSGGTRG